MSALSLQRFSMSALSCACAAVLLAACGGGGTDAGTADATAANQTLATSGLSTTSASTDTASVSPTTVTSTTDTAAASGPTTTTTATATPVSQVTAANSAPAPAPTAAATTTTPSASTAATATTTTTAPATTAATTTTTTTAPVTTTAAVPAAVTPFGQDASAYTLTFQEEFNSFDTSKWNDHIWYAGSNATKNYTVENGALKIWPQRDASGNFFDRTIDTDGKYYQTYGYFEMEAKFPVGKGTWPAFWLFGHPGERRPEIDIMEAYAGGNGWGYTDNAGIAHPNVYAPTVWVGDYDGHMAGTKMYSANTDLSAGFHKYAVKWEPNKQTFYYDGKEVLVVNVSMGDPMYIMLDLWFGSASGTPDDSTPQGKTNSYEVNYVRAWQFK